MLSSRSMLTLARFGVGICLATVLAMALSGCEEAENSYVAPAPPSVTVAKPTQRPVTEYLSLTGTVEAKRTVEVRARVQGFLEAVAFSEATEVAVGDLLYKIDPRPYQAQVKKAKADIARKQAELTAAQANYNRISRLFRRKAAPRVDLDKTRASRDIARAEVAAAKAALDEASLNLEFTEIKAPISGRVGRNLVDAGNLVGAGENTHLTTIVQYDPIWVYFSLDERELVRLMQVSNQNGGSAEKEGTPGQRGKIQMGIAGVEGYPFEGQLDFVDQGVDPETGTFLLRGIFPNPKPHAILPGMFARVRAPLQTRDDALVLPASAIGSDQSGRFVLTVNSENVVERKSVKIGALIENERVIEKGITADDQIVVNGLLRARPGAQVKPTLQLPSGS